MAPVIEPPRVAIVRTPSYDPAGVRKSIEECLDLLGDTVPTLAGNVLLKPNMIFPKPPEAAATTHPAIVAAVADAIRARYSPSAIQVGDSPGGVIGRIERFWDILGLRAVQEENRFELVPFETGAMEERTVTVGRQQARIMIAAAAARADHVINLPKLKTHSFTLFTGALKNIYGIIPGLLKANLHKQFRHPFDFAAFIVAINQVFKPSLHIMDAVVAMEGEGPSAGRPRPLGYILASTDPAALDATAATLIGLTPRDVPAIRIAGETEVGCIDTDRIIYPGLELKAIEPQPFERPQTESYTRIPRWLYRLLYAMFKTRPVMGGACVQCMKCAKMCPVKAITQDPEDGKVKVDYRTCIACFCCSEICEYRAVEIEASWLARKLLKQKNKKQ